jgi:hypothetical protein
MLESGERPLSDAQLLRPIAMVHAIEQALKSGKEVHVPQLLEAHT